MDLVGVHNASYENEDRLKELNRIKLKNLRLLVPEIHDLILMKTIRGYAHDWTSPKIS